MYDDDDWDDYLTEKKCSGFPSPIDIANAKNASAKKRKCAVGKMKSSDMQKIINFIENQKSDNQRAITDICYNRTNIADYDKLCTKRQVYSEVLDFINNALDKIPTDKETDKLR